MQTLWISQSVTQHSFWNGYSRKNTSQKKKIMPIRQLKKNKDVLGGQRATTLEI